MGKPEDQERDVALVRRMQEGDGRALTALYRLYTGNVFALIVRIVRDEDGACDVLQNVFKEVWDRRGEYREGRGTVVSWILRIAKTRAINAWRDAGTRDRYEEEAMRGAVVEEAEGSRRGLEMAELHALRAKLAPAMARLSDKHREILELSYFQEMGRQEIAKKLGIPPGTAGSRLNEAIEDLRQALGVHEDGGGEGEGAGAGPGAAQGGA